MGECPDWYTHIRVAKYLGVPPWDLLRQSVAWREWAKAAMNAEAHADEQRAKRRARNR